MSNEFRKANVIFSKNGEGRQTNKITLPVGWVKEMGLTADNREVIITFNGEKIEIVKKENFDANAE